jgi:citrate lyase subunit gamma (acyl carrier protein)
VEAAKGSGESEDGGGKRKKRFGEAQAGTWVSDCLVTVSPEPGGGVLDYRGGNARFFRARTERLLYEILERKGVSSVRVTIQDQGALEATLRARIETALERAVAGEGERA